MRNGISTPELTPELSPHAGADAFISFKADFPRYNAEELIAAFEEKLYDAARALIEAYGADDAGKYERRQALAAYGAIALAKHDFLYEVEYNPWAPPSWIELARNDLKSRTEEGSSDREIVESTPIFNEDLHIQSVLGGMVSSSLTPQGPYTSIELARGIVSDHVAIQPF
jgi:hypothetical protein